MKTLSLISFFFVACVIIYSLFFHSSPTNYKTAFIRTENDHFVVTVKGKRRGLVHDPISLIINSTYEESEEYTIPRSQGIIKGDEIPTEEGLYKYVGTINIQNNQLEIKLSLDNTDDKILVPDGWNGKYELVWSDKRNK